MDSPIVRFGMSLGGCLLIVASIVSGFFLMRIFLEAQASASWPIIAGTVTNAEVVEMRAAFKSRYETRVRYTYRVNDRDYGGKRIRASDGEYDNAAAATRALEGLAAGQEIRVHYDPKDPSRALLRAGAAFPEYALLSIPLVMLAMGMIPLLRVRSWRRRETARRDLLPPPALFED